MNAFDALTWLGHWPFAFLAERKAADLARHLRAHGIARALVSPLDAVFAPEPGPANRALFRAVRGVAALEPVPVINPALPDWRDQLQDCLDHAPVRLVRVLPSYHRVTLTGPAMAELGRPCLTVTVSWRRGCCSGRGSCRVLGWISRRLCCVFGPGTRERPCRG